MIDVLVTQAGIMDISSPCFVGVLQLFSFVSCKPGENPHLMGDWPVRWTGCFVSQVEDFHHL